MSQNIKYEISNFNKEKYILFYDWFLPTIGLSLIVFGVLAIISGIIFLKKGLGW